MGNKSHATGIRIGINQDWQATWYAPNKSYADTVLNDDALRDFIENKLKSAGVAKIKIKRGGGKVVIDIHVARPGVVIGRGGTGIQELNNGLKKVAGSDVEIKVIELKHPEASAKYVSNEIAKQLAARIAPKIAANRQIENAKNTGIVQGISVWIAGRIKGAEIARTEKYDWGNIPRHTLRADIDYNFCEINVPGAGRHGIKVWINKGEKLETN